LHVDLTRQCGKSPFTMSAVLHWVYLAWKHPRRRIEVILQVSRPTFPPRTWPCVRSKRLRGTIDSHVDLTRQCNKFPITMSAVLRCVYLAWKHPRRRIKVIFQVSRPAFQPRTRPCVRSKRLRGTMTCTLTSPDNLISPQLQ